MLHTVETVHCSGIYMTQGAGCMMFVIWCLVQGVLLMVQQVVWCRVLGVGYGECCRVYVCIRVCMV